MHIDSMANALKLIFDESMSTGLVPEDWKMAHVTPIHKKGAKGDTGNYRPVSLTSLPCRIMETCIREQISTHLKENQLINRSQHGFMKHKSCTTNLLEFMETVIKEYDENGNMDIIYLDFAKAFDKVNKERLLQKIKANRIDQRPLNWIRNWLSGRRQKTVLNGKSSEWGSVESGVPQGSVLGPLCFNIYIDDLDNSAPNITALKKFADDTKAAQKVRHDSDRAILQEGLDNIVNWSKLWGMEFNVLKCKVMHVGKTNPQFEYFCIS